MIYPLSDREIKNQQFDLKLSWLCGSIPTNYKTKSDIT